MTILQRLLLEAGTAAIIVLTMYALVPVLLIVVNAGKFEAPRKKNEEEEEA